MDTQPGITPVTPTVKPLPLPVIPAEGSVLGQLLDQFEVAKAAEAEAKERREGLRDRIEAVLTVAYPGVAAFRIEGSRHRPPMRLTWVKTVRLNTDELKNQAPGIYARFAVFGGRWELRKA